MDNELGSIVDSLPGLVWTALPDGHVDFLNGRWFEYTGISVEDAYGHGWQKAIHPNDLPHLMERWQSAISSGEPLEGEARMRRHDGEYRWFLFRTSPISDKTGTVRKWCGINWEIEDRKRGEKLLRESEQRFRTIFDEAGAGITLVDLTPGVPIRNNRALQVMLGCSEDELSRFETFDQLTSDANREADARVFRELCEGHHNTQRMEKHFIRRDGRSVWANVIFTLLRDAEDCPRYIIAIHEDITERKCALEKLQANQELLDLAQKAARAMAFDWYIQKRVNAWSPEQEALYGLAPGTFDGSYESWKKLIYPADWSQVVQSLKHAHETGDISVEFRVVWPDGSIHWLAANGQMFFDEQGQPFRMVGFTADVTSRKLVEEELRRSAAFLAQAQHLSSTGSFSWRPTTDEITWSDELLRIFEFEPCTPATTEQIRARVHPEDIVVFDKTVERARTTCGDFECQYRIVLPDHSFKYLRVVGQVTRYEQDKSEYVVAVQDVTERRLSEEALDKARSELAHVARAMTLGALTASIAHEVNQPLAGIITNASTGLRMLESDPPNVEGARETTRRTIRDGHRASDVINRLRALFSKKDTSNELIDLSQATREVIALSLNELERNRVILHTELADHLPFVTGDRVQLQQVILNLLKNGSDAMRGVDDRPRELVLRTELNGENSVRLSVQDCGVGFETQTMDRLFQAFYTTKDSGMGMGLSVCRSIIENHHGRLWATENSGPGVTFSFSIPCEAINEADSDATSVAEDRKTVARSQ